MKKVVQSLFGGVIAAAVLSSCRETTLNSHASQQVLSNPALYLDSKSQVRVFFNATENSPGQFVTELVVENNSVPLPKSLYADSDYGDREHPDSPQELDLIAKVYRPALENGDFYFETPILTSRIEVSNVTTALSWILRWGFDGEKIRISHNRFLSLINGVELLCQECRKKTNSEVVEFILGSQELRRQLLKVVQEQNRDLLISEINYAPPSAIYVWSNPNLSLNGFVAKESRETQSIEVKIVLLDPRASAKQIAPTSWVKNFDSLSTTFEQPILQYQFTYEDKGRHQIQPRFENATHLNNLTFQYDVTDLNRNPICNSVINLNFKANRSNEQSLPDYCRDLDIEDHTLVYSLVSGPAGLTISSAGVIKWTPPQMADNADYQRNVSFMVNDSKLGYAEVQLTIQVAADLLPVFISIPSPLNFSEATTSNYTIQAMDPDGDPIVLRVEPIDSINTLIPSGSGVLTDITRTGSQGNYSYQWFFMPSWLQTLGSNSTAEVRLALYYDPSDLSLNSGLRLTEQNHTLYITNTDDPPQWSTQPVEITIEEGTSMNMLYLGTAIDPAPNSTVVTYSMETNAEEKCNWALGAGMVVTSGGNVYFDLAPPYNSLDACFFNLVATDANGIRSVSDPFIVNIQDVNRPVVVKASPTTLINGTEMKSLKIDMIDFFEDPDFSEEDPREIAYTFTCLWDHDEDGNYDKVCDRNGAEKIRFLFNGQAFFATWTPSSTAAGTYKVRFTVTDKGNTSASHDLTIQIEQAPANMNLSLALAANNNIIDSLTVAENSTTQILLRARTATADAIDNYNIKTGAVACAVLGSGICSPGMVTIAGANTGTGDTDFVFNINAGFNDGDAALPGFAKTYNLRFQIEKSDDPNIYSEIFLTLTVNNTNRVPTAIGLSDGSNGCVGSTANSGTDTFVICIDVSKDTKVGTSWNKTYTSTFTAVDPDGTNDSYSFQWSNTFAPGTITTNKWEFKLPSCISKGTSTVNRYFNLELSDGRGGTLQREVNLKLLKAQTSGLCMQ